MVPTPWLGPHLHKLVLVVPNDSIHIGMICPKTVAGFLLCVITALHLPSTTESTAGWLALPRASPSLTTGAATHQPGDNLGRWRLEG